MDQAVNHIVGNENMNIGLSKQSLPRKENVLRTRYFVTQGQKTWPPFFTDPKMLLAYPVLRLITWFWQVNAYFI